MAFQNISQLFAPTFLNDSILTKTLGEEFALCENGNMVFHWADYFETCDFIKSQLDSNPALMDDFNYRERALERLCLIPVWIRTDNKIHQTTMHEMYERYILNQTQIDPFMPLDISFISSTGPFKGMSIAECFNKSTYRDFVLVYLLKGKLPRRDFRIRLKSKILMEYGQHFSEAHLVSLEQLTVNGMLLSMDSETYMKKIAQVSQVRILINTSMLGIKDAKSLIEVKDHLAPFAFNLLYSSNKVDSLVCQLSDFSIQSSFDFSKNKKVFMFIPYAKVVEGSSQGVKVIQHFVNMTRDLVRDHYQNSSKIKSA